MMFFDQLASITGGKAIQVAQKLPVENLLIDSRQPVLSPGSVFFSIQGPRHDGHQYISTLYELGLRQFVIEKDIELTHYPLGNFLRVKSSVEALQKIAAEHRSSFTIPVIGITGSNGKTIIKEWLSQLMPDQRIAKNPGSYNSQIGVPLSVWSLAPHHTLALFEAGISQRGEMEKLEAVIQPTIGLMTNIGPAHDEGFTSRNEKITEKLKLFSRAQVVICCGDQEDVFTAIKSAGLNFFSWGESSENKVVVRRNQNSFTLAYRDQTKSVALPFGDPASQENCFHCIATLLWLGYSLDAIINRIALLKPVSMRLMLKEGINNCQLIDDSYSNDLSSLELSLHFQTSLQGRKKTVILSDILQSGLTATKIAEATAAVLKQNQIQRAIIIGPLFGEAQAAFATLPEKAFYKSTDDFLSTLSPNSFHDELILVKGARVFGFERIVQRLQRKAHGTVMQIDLSRLVHNLNFFKSKLKPGVRLMAMVKAFAYGSGSEEVATLLQYHKVDYLGVAYPDEGIELRKKGITIPIMVMNPTEESYEALVENHLEPAMYSIGQLTAFVRFLSGRPAKIHLEVETGMHRLGLSESDVSSAIEILRLHKTISVASIFSHLAGSDEAQHDEYSKNQLARFTTSYDKISSALGITPLRHIANSAGILRLPEFQLDMVRLGIGLYGIDPSGEQSGLLPAASLKTVISQVKHVVPGETVGYGRRGKAEKKMTIATIAIGYADGFSRAFSRGAGHVLVNGKKAPVVGNVCMDMTMIDITGIAAQEGDEVIVFGDGLPIEEVASAVGTIPYEILTNTSARVKRVFVTEAF